MEEIDEQILAMFVRRVGAVAGVESSRVSLIPSASTVAQLRELVEVLTRRERARHRARLAEEASRRGAEALLQPGAVSGGRR